MQQRRWERALGTAIRAGQDAGEIAVKGGDHRTNSGSQTLVEDIVPDAKNVLMGSRKSPGAYALTDNATEAEFEDALTAAKNDGNVSRANVVRKANTDRTTDIARARPRRPTRSRTATRKRALTCLKRGA